jgi:hypothetical protein
MAKIGPYVHRAEEPAPSRGRWRSFGYAAIGGFVGLTDGGALLAVFNLHSG